MRTIKFRGLSGNEWQYGYYCFVEGVGYITSEDGLNTCYVKPNTVGQFTGLFDKNGKECYEGDKLRSGYEEFEDEYYLVVWNDKFACFQMNLYSYSMYRNEGGGEEYSSDISLIDENAIDMDCLSDFEIIGNIHQSPELI